MIYNQATGEVVGSTRYYEWNEEDNSIAIGYTFIARKFWGKGFNGAMKKLKVHHSSELVPSNR